MISGVMGGLGEYFAIDPVMLRVLLVLVVLATGIFPGVIAYVVAVFMIDETPFIAPVETRAADDDSAI